MVTDSPLDGDSAPPGTSPRFVYPVAAALVVVAGVLAALRIGERTGGLAGWQALVLGAVQGLTELLPISSSGHLILVPWISRWHYLEANPGFHKTFDVALHLGTLVAVAAYFWGDIARYIAAAWASLRRRSIDSDDERLAWCIAVATIPAGVTGALGEKVIEDRLGEPWQIALLLALFGIILWVADRLPPRRSEGDLQLTEGVVIGISQLLALAPGVSRSGITITSGRMLGLNRDAAARFSFLLLIPVVLGAVVYKGITDVILEPLPAGAVGPFVVGMLSSAGFGLVAVDLLLGYVRRHTYAPFVVYRIVAALFILAVIASGARSATF